MNAARPNVISFPLSPEAASLWTAAIMLLLTIFFSPLCHANSDPKADVGESIYLRGVLGSGELLESDQGGVRMKGRDAACVNCHRRSGFGTTEGRIVIPPIAGQYILRPDVSGPGDQYLPYVETMHRDRDPPYTEATLARAIREGVNAEGEPFNYLMPHFALNDSDMAALIDYLKRLDRDKAPGVTDTVLHFATIITPDADPVKRKAMLAVMKRYFSDRNLAQFTPTPRLRASTKTAWANSMFKVNRGWQLHVWQLTGPANTWEAQLQQHFTQEPVLAVVSGLGGKNWEPVHEFCEHQAVPCLFPNVEAPPVNADRDFYSLYFSKGVELEAELIANRITETGNDKNIGKVLQIYRAGDIGESAARVLTAKLALHGVTVHNEVIAPGHSVRHALRLARNAGTLVLWLRPTDIAKLGKMPAAPVTAFLSGLMGGLESAPLPSSWRGRTHLAYPFDLPERRTVPVDYALGWFANRHIPIVDEQIQADTFLACGLLAETLKYMADTFVPDYLVERIEDMLDHRIITGYYPHLSLGSGQRFASKGGYIVHFAEPTGTKLVADSGWITP
jgi:Cytochrome c